MQCGFWLSSSYTDTIAMVGRPFNATKPAKFYTSTNSSHLNTELYYQEDQLLIWYKRSLFGLILLGLIILVPLKFQTVWDDVEVGRWFQLILYQIMDSVTIDLHISSYRLHLFFVPKSEDTILSPSPSFFSQR